MSDSVFRIRGFNLCESVLRHTPGQLKTFIRRMKVLNFNTLIVQYDYGWRRFGALIREECEAAGVDIILMTFGVRTFYGLIDWDKQWFAKDGNNIPYCEVPECETQPCASLPEAREGFREGAEKFLRMLPPEIRRIHMRAGDGCHYCHCKKCVSIPFRDQWTPFVRIFLEAARKINPALKVETDIYYKRYEIPDDPEPCAQMDGLMYDTFGRNPLFPLDSSGARSPEDCAMTEALQDDRIRFHGSPNLYHAECLSRWCKIAGGGIYVHENAMMHRYGGVFQRNTAMLLEDLDFYRKLGVSGVCYEAYEPGFSFFEKSFSILAQAMNGRICGGDYSPSPLEKVLEKFRGGMSHFLPGENFPLKDYGIDPVERELIEFRRKWKMNPDSGLAVQMIDFVFQHRDKLDPVWLSFDLLTSGRNARTLRFECLNEEETDLLNSAKLWDFMERIPVDTDPLERTEILIFNILSKMKGVDR